MKDKLNYIGLGDILEEEGGIEKIKEFIIQNKVAEFDGFNYHYINAYSNPERECGIQFSLAKSKKDGSEKISINHTGLNAWNVKILGKINSCDSDSYIVYNKSHKENNKRTVAINLINKDISPSLLPYDEIKIQVCGFAHSVRIFAPDDPEQKNNFLKNHSINDDALIHLKLVSPDNNTEKRLITDTDITGVILEIHSYVADIMNHHLEYLGLLLNTCFGKLQLFFNFENIDYVRKGMLKAGNIIECSAELCGDVFLHKDSIQIEKNEHNNLRILRRSFTEQNFDFLRPIMADNCIYISHNFRVKGRDNIINLFEEIISKYNLTINVDIVSVVRTIKGKKNNTNLKIGDECLLYSENSSKPSHSLYIKNDENGMIKKIVLGTSRGIKYAVDFPYEYFNAKYNEESKTYRKDINKLYPKIVKKYYSYYGQKKKA